MLYDDAELAVTRPSYFRVRAPTAFICLAEAADDPERMAAEAREALALLLIAYRLAEDVHSAGKREPGYAGRIAAGLREDADSLEASTKTS